MGRGLLGGLGWGMLVAGVVLILLSLGLPLPDAPGKPQAPQALEVLPAPDAPADGMPVPAAPMRGPGQMPAPPDVAAPILPGPVAAPVSAPSPVPLTQGALRDQAPVAAGPITAPADSIAETPPQPAPQNLPGLAPPHLARAGDTGAVGVAPNRIMAQEPEQSLAGIDTAPPPVQMPTPSLDPVATPVAAPIVVPVVVPQTVTQAAAHALAPPAPTAPEPAMPDVPRGALVAHAVGFDLPDDQPLFAIVLIDDPASPLDPGSLSRFRFPVSFALDPSQPDAAARAALVRAAGFEVVILAPASIAEAAVSGDVDLALAAARATLSHAVAVIDRPAVRPPARPVDPAVPDAIATGLADTGHGLITLADGQNALQSLPPRARVAAAPAFRLLDDADQRAPLITRYLDRAAFAAVQDGAVIVVGRTRPDTIEAVLSWALRSATKGVRLAPVSAAIERLSQ